MKLLNNAFWRAGYDRTRLLWTKPHGITCVAGRVA
jgi:hypothetical protein